MASELYVETLKGLTSGANANKVIIPSGQTLDIDAWLPPAGTVLQVVTQTKDYKEVLSSTSYAAMFNIDITPLSASSKILICIKLNHIATDGNNVSMYRLQRSGTTIGRVNSSSSGLTYNNDAFMGFGGSGTARDQSSFSWDYEDSPNTTVQITYNISGKLENTGNTHQINAWGLNTDCAANSSVTLWEIAG